MWIWFSLSIPMWVSEDQSQGTRLMWPSLWPQSSSIKIIFALVDCVCVYGQRTPYRSWFFPPTGWVLGWDSGCQVWWQAPFLAEPAHQPSVFQFYVFCCWLLFNLCACVFTCMSLCLPYTCRSSEARKGHWLSWTWSYRWLVSHVWAGTDILCKSS